MAEQKCSVDLHRNIYVVLFKREGEERQKARERTGERNSFYRKKAQTYNFTKMTFSVTLCSEWRLG